jgi:ATP-binding cassette subfamily A (ABC1) protein 3
MTSAGICYQEDTIWKYMTPDRIMTVFSFIVGVSDRHKCADQMFERLDIERELKNRKFSNLSGGNKRKICMAVCLLGSPKIKLLDECSTGLDPVSRLSMVNTLNLQTSGTTVFTTHSIPEAEQVCSRAIIMKKGQVSENNKIFKLKEKYYHCYWVELFTD